MKEECCQATGSTFGLGPPNPSSSTPQKSKDQPMDQSGIEWLVSKHVEIDSVLRPGVLDSLDQA